MPSVGSVALSSFYPYSAPYSSFSAQPQNEMLKHKSDDRPRLLLSEELDLTSPYHLKEN